MKFKDLKVEWKGHSGFFIKDKKGTNIYIDPYKLSSECEEADIIFITHPHYDHCSFEDLEKIVKNQTVVICPPDCQSKLTRINKNIDIKIMTPGQNLETKGLDIKAVPAYNPEKHFHEKGEGWNGYLIKIEDVSIYHSGDTGVIPEMSDLGESTHIDLALLPVGGKFTMSADEAARAVVLLRPNLSIPMHWGEVIGGESDAERFVELCKEEDFEAEVLDKK